MTFSMVFIEYLSSFMTDSHSQKRVLRIQGMHCASCDIIVERNLSKVPGVVEVEAHHATGRAVVTTNPASPPDDEALHAAVRKAGYSLAEGETSADETFWRDVAISIVLLMCGYFLLRRFDLGVLAPSTADIASLGAVLVVGLVAGTSSCLAVTGGLLLAVCAKHAERHGAESVGRKLRPILFFNAGRLASYFVLGGAIGALGQSLSLTPRMTGYVNIAVAVVMIAFALSILHLLPRNAFRLPKAYARRIADLSDSDHPAAPALLGAMTFFLPCGFTQSLQLVALASGSATSGAAIMFTFALGTLPFLLGVGVLSVSLKGSLSRSFLRFSGVTILALAAFNLQTGFALAGIGIGGANPSVPAAAPVQKGGVQQVAMTVGNYGYEPSSITIKAGVPVRWVVDGTLASGCTSVLTIPDLNITKSLVRGANVIEFTAPERGTLAFMCSMGMVRGAFTVI